MALERHHATMLATSPTSNMTILLIGVDNYYRSSEFSTKTHTFTHMHLTVEVAREMMDYLWHNGWTVTLDGLMYPPAHERKYEDA